MVSFSFPRVGLCAEIRLAVIARTLDQSPEEKLNFARGFAECFAIQGHPDLVYNVRRISGVAWGNHEWRLARGGLVGPAGPEHHLPKWHNQAARTEGDGGTGLPRPSSRRNPAQRTTARNCMGGNVCFRRRAGALHLGYPPSFRR